MKVLAFSCHWNKNPYNANMTTPEKRMEQLVDWSAAVWAGLISGMLFLLYLLFVLPKFTEGLSASLLVESIINKDSVNAGGFLLAAVIVMVICVLYALLIASLIHREGLIAGILFGAVLGFSIFVINVFVLSILFNNPVLMLGHILFGALVGGIYEWFEVEEFVPVEAETQKETS